MGTFTLTTGADNYLGTSGDDVITGTTATWQPATDTINGDLSGNDRLQIAVLTAAAASVTDDMFKNLNHIEVLGLTGSFAETVKLGSASDTAKIAEIDGSGLTGNLTVDASARMWGITVDTSKGVDNLVGTADDDTFRFTSAGLTSADKVNGGGTGDIDTLQITDKAAVTDVAFTNVSHVEHLALGGNAIDYTGQKATLGAHSIAAGITEVDVLDAQGATLDATARTVGITLVGGSGDDVFKASQGNDTFEAGAGADSYQVKGAQFTGADAIDGGGGRDEIRIIDSGTPIVDAAFQSSHSVETLAFNAAGKQTVTLDADAAAAGIDTIDASKVSGGLALTLGAGMTNHVTVLLGTGADTVALGTGGSDTVLMKSTSLTKTDTITGDGNDFLAFSDNVKLTDASFLNFSGVHGMAYLELNGTGAGQSFVAGADFKSFVTADGLQEIIANGASPTTSVTFDFSKYTGPALTINGSGGGDVYINGSADNIYFASASNTDQGVGDSFRYGSANYTGADIIFGGKSAADELVFLDDKTTILDTDFANTHGIEHIRLTAATTGTYDLQLGAEAQNAGIALVDASKAGVNVAIDAHTMTNGVTFLAGTKSNAFIAGKGDDTVLIDTKSLNGSDILDGGKSTDGDILHLTTAGAVTAAALTNVTSMEVIQFSDLGNSITLTDAIVGTNEGVLRTYDGYTSIDEAYVVTGKGHDTVDLSQLSTFGGHVAVIGSAGDTYIGSAGNDTFTFQKSADLTATTKIDGGAGGDGLTLAAGTYSAAQFHGLTHIDGLYFSDANANADFKVTLDSTIFKTSDSGTISVLDIHGSDNLTIDASAVTDPFASLKVFQTSGDESIKGTAGNDFFYFGTDNTGNAYLDSNDTIVGGGGTDTIALLTNYNGIVSIADPEIAHVSGVEALFLQGGSNTQFDVTADAAFQASGFTEINGFGSAGKLFIDASQYTADILVHAGQNADSITTGSGDDTIEFQNTGVVSSLTSSDHVDGGTGHDTLLFVGDASVTDAAFTSVVHVEEIDLAQGSSGFHVTLGANSDAAGITTVDGSAAGDAQAFIDGSASSKALTLIGADHVDVLTGGASADHLIGGGGSDIMTGNGGNDIFVYESAADSRQFANGNVGYADIITDFSNGDQLDVEALLSKALTAVTNLGTVANFATNDTAGFYQGNEVAVATNGVDTRVYVDANHDGAFTLGQDLVVQFTGNHLSQLVNTSSYH